MILDGVAAPAIAGAGTLCGLAGFITALRSRAAARTDRLALRFLGAREAAAQATARELAAAVRASVAAVREVICTRVCTLAPMVDAVLLYEERDAALLCVHAFGERVRHFAGSQLAVDDVTALAVRARAAGHRVMLGAKDVRAPHPTATAAIAVPLALDAGRSAVLVACAHAALDEETQRRIASLADHAAFAYHLALERERDRRSAEFDALTGLLTPHAFRTTFAAMPVRERRGALLFIDIDRFKAWNDAYGHAAGDALLREIARVLRAAARPNDLAARNGGDEFCLVLDGVGKADAIERAESLRAAIAAIDFASLRPAGSDLQLAVAASIGVAAYPSDARDAALLLERADAAMYHAKRSGRDGVAYAERDGSLTRFVGVAA
jgi:diguanylate cyclase (GGDEF)-like protein